MTATAGITAGLQAEATSTPPGNATQHPCSTAAAPDGMQHAEGAEQAEQGAQGIAETATADCCARLQHSVEEVADAIRRRVETVIADDLPMLQDALEAMTRAIADEECAHLASPQHDTGAAAPSPSLPSSDPHEAQQEVKALAEAMFSQLADENSSAGQARVREMLLRRYHTDVEPHYPYFTFFGRELYWEAVLRVAADVRSELSSVVPESDITEQEAIFLLEKGDKRDQFIDQSTTSMQAAAGVEALVGVVGTVLSDLMQPFQGVPQRVGALLNPGAAAEGAATEPAGVADASPAVDEEEEEVAPRLEAVAEEAPPPALSV
eukprot:TRINITY_DN38265_c0_g1_i1.p1 TRINITY_DN38265_c0_g1~~TRINITY_DN38265_c0_g1_i1.p1  ORF type:complete len:358 (+),score=145.60 TRINITY_DN38265_c0_g1_i1:110-1075(+)